MSIVGWILIILGVLYVLGFFWAAHSFEYGYSTTPGTDKFVGAVLWPIILAYTFWRVWTKQIPATLRIKRKGVVVRTYHFGKKV